MPVGYEAAPPTPNAVDVHITSHFQDLRSFDPLNYIDLAGAGLGSTGGDSPTNGWMEAVHSAYAMAQQFCYVLSSIHAQQTRGEARGKREKHKSTHMSDDLPHQKFPMIVENRSKLVEIDQFQPVSP